MPRRISLPAAEDLFRRTDPGPVSGPVPVHQPERPPVRAVEPHEEPPARRPSGRVRHDEKMTVYVTAKELHDVEHARLRLRSTHGLAVDRGRFVREALAIVLADFEANGEDSVLVQRLSEA